MKTPQAGILTPLPPRARYLSFSISDPKKAASALALLQADKGFSDGTLVLGVGISLVKALGGKVSLLKAFPNLPLEFMGKREPEVLWLWLKGEEAGLLFHKSRALIDLLSPAFSLDAVTDAFVHQSGRDLTGFEDGTENPQEAAAFAAAICQDALYEGASFVAIQRWEHDFSRFGKLDPTAKNHAIGRDQVSNEELDDAPASAHVKRTAQESFEPEAFLLRRSMPWVERMRAGLYFVAFGRSFEAFEAQTARMTGREDGVQDALYGFTKPVSSAYYWCPPLEKGRLDLSLLGV